MFNSKLKTSILLKSCVIAVALIVFSSTNSSAQEKPPWQIENKEHEKECLEGRKKVKARAIERATVLDESLRDEFVSQVLENYNGSCKSTRIGVNFYEPLLVGYESIDGCLRGIEKNYEYRLQSTKRRNESIEKARDDGKLAEITPLSEVKRRISSCDMDLSRCVDAEKLRARMTGDTKLKHLITTRIYETVRFSKEKFDEYNACRVDYMIKEISSGKDFSRFGDAYNSVGAKECGKLVMKK